MHEEGFGVTQDLSTAEELYMDATEQACLEGWLSLGFLCVKVAPLAMYFVYVADIANSPGLVSKLWKLNYTQQINVKRRGSIVPVLRAYLYTHTVVVNRSGHLGSTKTRLCIKQVLVRHACLSTRAVCGRNKQQ